MRHLTELAICLAWAFSPMAAVAFSQEEVAPPESKASEIRFQVLKEPVEKRLFQGDVKEQLKQTVVASVVLQSSVYGEMDIWSSNQLERVKELATLGDRSLLAPSIRVSRKEETMSESLQAIAMSIPEDNRPQEEQLAFFFSEEANTSVMLVGREEGFDSRKLIKFEILAPNEDVARARAKALISLLQKGIGDPIRRYLNMSCGELVSKIDSRESRLKEIGKALEKVANTLAEMGDVEGIELNRLKSQQRLFDIDVIGVRARIRAVEKLRSQYSDDLARAQKLDDIKIAAEIDLAGFEASKEAINKVVKLCEQKANLENERKQLHDESKKLEDGLKTARAVLERYRKSTEIAKDLLTPCNNEIIITPIEWVQ